MSEDMSSNSVELIDDHLDYRSTNNVEQKTSANVQLINCIWKLASSEHSWVTCPIGKLPWLMQKDSSSEMET